MAGQVGGGGRKWELQRQPGCAAASLNNYREPKINLDLPSLDAAARLLLLLLLPNMCSLLLKAAHAPVTSANNHPAAAN